MKIKNVLIKNFKSIKELNIPFQDYGTGHNKSKTAFLVGINESGKSAILEAIGLIKKGFKDIDYDEYCFLEAQEESEYIDLYSYFEIENIQFWKEKIGEKLNLKEDFIEKLEFLEISKNDYINDEHQDRTYKIKINDDLSFHEYIIETTQKNVNGRVEKNQKIENLQVRNEIKEKITASNASSFLKENQKLLTKGTLESNLVSELETILDDKIPEIQFWKSSPEYLINETIDLEKFKEDTDISIPLKNMFHVYGKKTDKEIKNTIERALKHEARSAELEHRMSEAITKHINRIWKEHKIKINISINSSKCAVHIEDNDKKYSYFNMAQRSDGFKQFVALILSLSAQNNSKKLNDRIILIDEPEVHLHPSGVKYMRDEILKIGKNNYIFVATHSQDMVDTTTPERHWVVQKQKSETSLLQVDDNTPIKDDKVLTAAFGLNLFKELLPRNILIVEGGGDKYLISHALHLLQEKFFYSIKSAGGASKTPAFASLLSEEKIPSFILFDSDKEGLDYKKRILKDQKDFYSDKNVFSLKDLNKILPNNSTIEDILPVSFVQDFFSSEMDQDFDLIENQAVIIQIKNQCPKLKSNKQKLDSLKIELARKFTEDFKTRKRIEEIKRISDLIDALVIKMNTELEH